MSLAILFYFLCTQHVSDVNISLIRSLRLCRWITTSVVLFSVRCVLVIWCCWVWVVSVLQASLQHEHHSNPSFSLQHGHHSNPAAPNYQHTTSREQSDQCGNSSTAAEFVWRDSVNHENFRQCSQSVGWYWNPGHLNKECQSSDCHE